MRSISHEEMPISWGYWLSVALFLAMFCGGIWLIFADNGKDREVGIAACLISFTLGLGGLLWPFLRRRELQVMTSEYVRTAEISCEAILFPASRVKQHFVIFGSLLMTLGALGLTISANNAEHRVEGVVAAAFMGGVFVLSLMSLRHGRFGILLLPNGIIWREMFRAPYFIPWQAVDHAALFRKKERYNPKLSLAFGLNITDPALIQTTPWSREKLMASKKEHGWNLYFLAETVLVPLTLLAGIVEFYRHHPEARDELGTGGGQARFKEIESSQFHTPSPA